MRPAGQRRICLMSFIIRTEASTFDSNSSCVLTTVNVPSRAVSQEEGRSTRLTAALSRAPSWHLEGQSLEKHCKSNENPGCVLKRTAAPSPSAGSCLSPQGWPSAMPAEGQDLWNQASTHILFLPLDNTFLTAHPICLTEMRRANAVAEIFALRESASSPGLFKIDWGVSVWKKLKIAQPLKRLNSSTLRCE